MMRTDTGVITVLLLIAMIFSPLWGEQVESHDRSLSFVYSDIAASLISDEPSSSYNLAGIALEFDPENGDAGFIHAVILLKNQDISLHEIKRILKTAYDRGFWKIYSKEVCRIQLAKVYDQLMDYEQLNLLILEGASDLNRSADWYYYAARGAFMTGDKAGALQLLKEGTSLFPEDRKLILERLRIDSAYADMLIRNYFSSAKGFSPGIEVLSGLAAAADPAVRESLLSVIHESGAESLEAELLTAEQLPASPEDETDLSPLLNNKYLTKLDYFNRIMSLFNQHQQIEEFWQALEGKSITIQGDNNNDGYPEETYRIESGTVTAYLIDTDQDRVMDYSVDFTSDNPQSGSIPSVQRLTIYGMDTTLTFTYSKYPSVGKLDAQLPDGTGKVLFAPGELEISGIHYSPGPLDINIALSDLQSYGELERAGYYTEEEMNNSSMVRKHSGPPVMISDEGVTRTIVTETYRKIERDLNDDGIYEITEIYDLKEGNTRIDLDYDSDGITDYSYSSSEGNEKWTWTEYPVSAE